MRLILVWACMPVSLILSSCQPDRAGPTGPEAPLDPAAKFVVWAAVVPDPGETDFSPFGEWKPFEVDVNLSDLSRLRVIANPSSLTSTRVLEIYDGAAPPTSNYCRNGAEWDDTRSVGADDTLFLAACQAGPAVLVIQSRSGTSLDTLYFEVIDPDAEPAFNIELVFVDPAAWTPEQIGVFEQAAQRWEDIITEDITGDADFSRWPFDSREVDWWVSSGRYDLLGDILVDDEVDDLRVFVGRVLSGEDKPLGLGGAFQIRRGSVYVPQHGGWIGPKLPSLASINVHEELFEAPHLDNGNLLSTIEHELGHCLGFGTIWEIQTRLGLSAQIQPGADTYFSGWGARGAFYQAGGWSYTGNKVPVENDPDLGVDGHWREGVFGDEVMSSRGGAREPLSAITIQSLADLGYTVDVGQADSYTLPVQPAAKPLAASRRPFCQVLMPPSSRRVYDR